MIYQHGHFKVSSEIKELPGGSQGPSLIPDLEPQSYWSKLSATTSQIGASRWFSGRRIHLAMQVLFLGWEDPWIRK